MTQMFGSDGRPLMAAAIMISGFGCANGLILSGARVYYAMAKDGLFFRKRRQTASDLQNAGGFADGADGMDLRAVHLRQLRATARLHHFCGAGVLYFDDCGIVRAAADASECRAALSGGRISSAAGVYIVMALFIDVVLLRYKPQYTWPGLIVVLLGIPVYYAWSREAPTGESASSRSVDIRRNQQEWQICLATKPLNLLMEEARETGEHSLKRTLGVFQLTALGVGAIIGAGIFVMVGLGAHYAGPGTDSVVRPLRPGVRLRRTLLCGIRGHDSAGGQRLHLRVCHAGRIARLDHRLGPDARIRHGRQHGVVRMVEPLHRAARISFTSRCRCGWPTITGRR